MNTKLVEAVKAHAMAHYNEGGWDVIVECYTDEDIWDHIVKSGQVGTEKDAIEAFEVAVSIWADRQADAENSRF